MLQVFVDLYLPDSKKFSRTLDLFGPIDPTASTFVVLGTKVLAQAVIHPR